MGWPVNPAINRRILHTSLHIFVMVLISATSKDDLRKHLVIGSDFVSVHILWSDSVEITYLTKRKVSLCKKGDANVDCKMKNLIFMK